MSWWRRLRGRYVGHKIAVVYHPDYRLPMTTLEHRTGFQPRRADFVAWLLSGSRYVTPAVFRRPLPIAWRDMARVHDASWLEGLGSATQLARAFGIDPSDIPVDATLDSFRLACGGTLLAARLALGGKDHVFNLFGGFHHAARYRGSGGCPINDIGIAAAALRDEGFTGRILVIDVDAHPPDGTADVLRDDPNVWIGSISGSDWGPIDGADEVLLPEGTEDAAYLAALDALLQRMPPGDLAFVVAGGDVLASDPMGRLGLTLDGIRQRDLKIARALHCPVVWLPAGGYTDHAWRAFAGTVLAAAFHSSKPVPETLDPLAEHLGRIMSSLPSERVSDFSLDDDDLAAELGIGYTTPKPRLLGFYTASGIEYAFHRYGILGHLERLGFTELRVSIGRATAGDRMRLTGRKHGREHTLVESVLSRSDVAGRPLLFCNWMTLRNPTVPFSRRRPALPGQDAPGLGLAREASELLRLVARRLDCEGVGLRPAHFHVAYAARNDFSFVEPEVQGRFEALLRDMDGRNLLDITTDVDTGRIRLNGRPYAWESELMVSWLDRCSTWTEAQEQRRDAIRSTTHFLSVSA